MLLHLIYAPSAQILVFTLQTYDFHENPTELLQPESVAKPAYQPQAAFINSNWKGKSQQFSGLPKLVFTNM